jgi:S1-C subfamily serine protease
MAGGRRLDSSGGAARAVGAACIALALALTAVIAFRWGSAGTGDGDGAAVATAPGSATTSSTGPLTPAQIYARVLPSLVYITVHMDGGTADDTSASGTGASATSTPSTTAVRPTAARTTARTSAPGTSASGTTTAADGGGDDLGPGVGIGTGLVVSSAGLVLTANHVVSGATSIRLAFADGTVSAASISSSDPSTDTATLMPATPPSPIVPAVLGSSDRLVVGDPVVAIGNPLGLAASTSSGVVSGLDRTAPSGGDSTLTGLIQFDAAVNPGNSGGPLLDSHGQAVGIVVELLNASGDDSFAGIGLAVPIGTALAGGGGPAPQK